MHPQRVSPLFTSRKTVFTIIKNKAGQLPPDRKPPSSLSELEDLRREVLSQWSKLARVEKAEDELAVRKLVTTRRKGYRIEKVQFLSESGIYIPAWVLVPDAASADRTKADEYLSLLRI